jgi:hypothetical protein
MLIETLYGVHVYFDGAAPDVDQTVPVHEVARRYALVGGARLDINLHDRVRMRCELSAAAHAGAPVPRHNPYGLPTSAPPPAVERPLAVGDRVEFEYDGIRHVGVVEGHTRIYQQAEVFVTIRGEGAEAENWWTVSLDYVRRSSGAPVHAPARCTDCKGSGTYTSCFSIEPCRACGGRGER